MRPHHQLLNIVSAAVVSAVLCGCDGRHEYPNRPIQLVCPWSAGGGTDRTSRQVAALLEQQLDVPVNVVNATGGAGVTGHTRGALARPDGYTITMVTVEINMLHWRGLTTISPDDFEPVGLLNRDAAALFVRGEAEWETLAQLEQHIRENPGKLKASGTAQGGIWHLGFAGWLDQVGLQPTDAIWVPLNGSAPSLQELIAGGVDAVCCSLPEAQALLDAGRVRCLGVMSDDRLAPYPDVPTFREQGVEWTLTGWRGVCLPKGSPPEVQARLSAALEEVVRGRSFRTFMRDAGFDVTWQPPDEFAGTMALVDQQLGRLLTSEALQGMRRTRFGPLFFPTILAVLLGGLLVVLATTGQLKRPPQIVRVNARDAIRLAEIAAWVVAYVIFAEVFGFVITATCLLVLLLVRLGNRPLTSVAVSAVVVAATYQLFAVGLRVPLPRGWLGW